MHHFARLGLLAFIALGAFNQLAFSSSDWPQFRGPRGDGQAPEASPPIEWSETNHVLWKTPIHGRAWSSPVVSNQRIWLTTATEDGTALSGISVATESGEIIFDDVLFVVKDPQFAHKFNSYASPSPIIDENRVYLTFGSPGTACLDLQTGKTLWKRSDIHCDHFRGAGSSPIIDGDLLIMNFDGSDHQFITAWDKRTGKTRWRTDRSIDFKDLNEKGEPFNEGDFRKAFSTPHIGHLAGTRTLVSIGAKACYGYEPLTGRELWRYEERNNHSGATRPLIIDNWLFYSTGFSKGEFLAFELTANHPTPSDSSLVWSTSRSVPKKPSSILSEGRLYLLNDGGILTCLDAHTGDELWNERIGGNYSASPILANGKIYCFSQEGKCVVVNDADTFEIIAENTLDAGFMASPAVLDDSLILRTESHLYRIGPLK